METSGLQSQLERLEAENRRLTHQLRDAALSTGEEESNCDTDLRRDVLFFREFTACAGKPEAQREASLKLFDEMRHVRRRVEECEVLLASVREEAERINYCCAEMLASSDVQ